MLRIATNIAAFLIGSLPLLYSGTENEPVIKAQLNEQQLISECQGQGYYPLPRQEYEPGRWQNLMFSAEYDDGKFFICVSK